MMSHLHLDLRSLLKVLLVLLMLRFGFNSRVVGQSLLGVTLGHRRGRGNSVIDTSDHLRKLHAKQNWHKTFKYSGSQLGLLMSA